MGRGMFDGINFNFKPGCGCGCQKVSPPCETFEPNLEIVFLKNGIDHLIKKLRNSKFSNEVVMMGRGYGLILAM